MTRKIIILSTALCLLVLSSSLTFAQQKNKQVEFFRYSEGVAINLIRERLLEENPDYRDILGRPPGHTVAQVDLNGDKTPELIVRIDDEYNFCDEDGMCDTRVYVYQGSGLIEIGKFVGSYDIRVSSETTDNIKNLLVKRLDKKYDLYQWYNNTYTKVTP